MKITITNDEDEVIESKQVDVLICGIIQGVSYTGEGNDAAVTYTTATRLGWEDKKIERAGVGNHLCLVLHLEGLKSLFERMVSGTPQEELMQHAIDLLDQIVNPNTTITRGTTH